MATRLLLLSLLFHSAWALSMSAVEKPVLVVGATGRVGRQVVQQLMAQGRPVRAMVRSAEKAESIFGTSTGYQYPPLQVVHADLVDYNDAALEQAVQGCSAVISASGSVRFAKWTDFLPWRIFLPQRIEKWAEPSHPYYTNYRAHAKLLELSEKHGIEKFVRLTGLGLAFPAYHPFSVLFNVLLSLNNRWGLLTEQAVWESPVSSVVVRPGGLATSARNTTTTNLQIDASGQLPYPGRVGRTDVAALLIESLQLKDSYTLACRWCGDGVKPKPQGRKQDGYATAAECVENLLAKSPPPPAMKPYGLVAGLVVYSFLALALKVAYGLFGIARRIFLSR